MGDNQEQLKADQSAPSSDGGSVPAKKPSSDTKSGTSRPTRPPSQSHQPSEQFLPQKFGKANPTRDAMIFIGIISFLLIISYSFDDIGRNLDENGEKKEKKLGTYARIKAIQKEYKHQIKASVSGRLDRRDDCSLFLGRSSMPGTGLGVFAGKNFSQGDFVVSFGVVGNRVNTHVPA
jgi:hypothetical protein